MPKTYQLLIAIFLLYLLLIILQAPTDFTQVSIQYLDKQYR